MYLAGGFVPGSAARLVAAVLLCALGLCGRAPAQSFPDPRAAAETKPIQDNSFLVEEAYNQERGVVQHVSTFTRLFQSRGWTYTFTEEWPWRSERHQFSYVVAATSPGVAEPRSGGGIGDTLINYRYQLAGNGDARVAFAPRVTLIAPSGNAARGRGFGGSGFQTNLPLSIAVSRHWVTHWNAGATVIPSAANDCGDHALSVGYNLGQSVVWLAHPRFNVLLETVWSASQTVAGRGLTETAHSFLVSPGVRWAYNFKSGLQIVPGIAVPLGVGPSAGEKGVFVYLSFEHPLGRRRT